MLHVVHKHSFPTKQIVSVPFVASQSSSCAKCRILTWLAGCESKQWMVRCHSNSAVSTIPYEVLCKENAVLQRRQYATTASCDGFSFCQGLVLVLAARQTVTHTCRDHEEHIARCTPTVLVPHQVFVLLFCWIDLARTSQRENPVRGVHCQSIPH